MLVARAVPRVGGGEAIRTRTLARTLARTNPNLNLSPNPNPNPNPNPIPIPIPIPSPSPSPNPESHQAESRFKQISCAHAVRAERRRPEADA